MKKVIEKIKNLLKDKNFSTAIQLYDSNSNLFQADKEWQTDFYFLQDLLQAHKEIKEEEYFYKFLSDINLDVILKNKYTVSKYGWCLYEFLKASKDKKLKNQENLIIRALELIKLLDLSFHSVLFGLLLYQIVSREAEKTTPTSQKLIEIFKAIDIKNNINAQDQLKNNEYILAKCLDLFRKSKETKLALIFLKSNILNININTKTSDELRNSFGWLLYSSLKYGHEAEDKALTQAIENIKLFSTKDRYSPFSKLFKQILRVYKNPPNPNWSKILEFLNLFSPNELSAKCDKQDVNNGKTLELASDLEDWYSNKIKALSKLKHFKEVISLGKEALIKIDKFHYRNDQWINRFIGLALFETGNNAEAISYLKKFIKKNRDWYGKRDIAEIYLKFGKSRYALEYAIEAALAEKKDTDKKGKLYSLIGRVLEDLNINLDIAYKHYCFAAFTRLNSKWEVTDAIIEGKQRLKQQIQTTNLDKLTYQELKSDLINYWKSKTTKNKKPRSKFTKGFISSLNISKKCGTITGEKDNIKYFFYFSDCNKKEDSIKKNDKVSFISKSPKKEGLLPSAKSIRVYQNKN